MNDQFRAVLIGIFLVVAYMAWQEFSVPDNHDNSEYENPANSEILIARRMSMIPSALLDRLSMVIPSGKKYQILPYTAEYSGSHFFDGQLYPNRMHIALKQENCDWVEELSFSFVGAIEREPHRILVTNIYRESNDAKRIESNSHFKTLEKKWVSSTTVSDDETVYHEWKESYRLNRTSDGFQVSYTKPETKQKQIHAEDALLHMESIRYWLGRLSKGERKIVYHLLTDSLEVERKEITVTPIDRDRHSLPEKLDLYLVEEKSYALDNGEWRRNNITSIRIMDSHGLLIYEEYDDEYVGKTELVLEMITLEFAGVCNSE